MIKQRQYQPYWNKLVEFSKIKVQVTSSDNSAVQKRLIRTLRKAIQKEKLLDLNFRSLYPNAKLITLVTSCGKYLYIELDYGLSKEDGLEIFGESNE